MSCCRALRGSLRLAAGGLMMGRGAGGLLAAQPLTRGAEAFYYTMACAPPLGNRSRQWLLVKATAHPHHTAAAGQEVTSIASAIARASIRSLPSHGMAASASTMSPAGARGMASRPGRPPPRIPQPPQPPQSTVPAGVGKLGHYMKEYGLSFTLWWTSAWIISGFGVYGVISSGIIGGEDAIGWLRAAGVGRLFDLDNISPGVGNLAVTIAINEALEVVRLPFVIATTPYIAKIIPKGRGGHGGLGQMIKTHGAPFLGLWVGTWLVTGATLYGLLAGGVLGGEDAISLIRRIPMMDQMFNLDALNPDLGNVALALAANECLEIVRLPLCLAMAPRLGRFMGRWR